MIQTNSSLLSLNVKHKPKKVIQGKKNNMNRRKYINKIKNTCLKDWADTPQNANKVFCLWLFSFYLLVFVTIILTIYWTSWVSAKQLTYITSFYPLNNPHFINKNTEAQRGKETCSCPKNISCSHELSPRLCYSKPQVLNHSVTSNTEERLRAQTLRPDWLGSNIVWPFKSPFISLYSVFSSTK